MISQGKMIEPTEDNAVELRPSILLVDDELAVIQALQRRFRPYFRIIPATDGQYAIELLRAGLDFAAIMTDYQMPNVTGVDVLEVAKKTHPVTPRVLFTGRIDEFSSSLDCAAFGPRLILLKPLDAGHVVDLVKHMIWGHCQI